MTNTTGQERALKEALEKAVARFNYCADMIAKGFNITGTLRAEHTIKAQHFALEAQQVLDATPPNSGKSRDTFIEAIREAAPNGEEIAVRYHANNDWSVANAPLSALPQQAATDEGEANWLTKRVAEVVEEDGGCWSACSGCQESVDGYVSSKDYPRSSIFKCQPGSGCRECGGLGVIWQDGQFLASYGDALSTTTSQPPAAETRLTENLAEIIEAELHRWKGANDGIYAIHAAALGVFNALSAALTQPEPTAQQGGEEADKLRHKLWMVMSHASGGHLSNEADVDRSTNDICVTISQHHNRVWQAALEKGREEALSAQQAAGEAVAWLKEWDSQDGLPPMKRRRVDLSADLDSWMPADTIVTPLYAAPQPEAPAEVQHAVAVERIEAIIKEQMREWWDEICDDTGCHPLDIRRHKTSLWYEPRHWTDAVAKYSAQAIAALATPQQGQEVEGWHPIETAPNDGTPIILFCPPAAIVTGNWCANLNGNDEAGWTDYGVQSWGYEEYRFIEPTHWMPLPSTPTAAGES